MKTGTEAVVVLVDLLQEVGIDYMLVGSFSSNFYGVARATADADLVEVLAVQGQGLDFDYIRRWCSEHGTSGILAKAIRDAGLPDNDK
jgi:hypothetical protein